VSGVARARGRVHARDATENDLFPIGDDVSIEDVIVVVAARGVSSPSTSSGRAVTTRASTRERAPRRASDRASMVGRRARACDD
jgi:hypothetical protein